MPIHASYEELASTIRVEDRANQETSIRLAAANTGLILETVPEGDMLLDTSFDPKQFALCYIAQGRTFYYKFIKCLGNIIANFKVT
jgi:hypothetical protein